MKTETDRVEFIQDFMGRAVLRDGFEIGKDKRFIAGPQECGTDRYSDRGHREKPQNL